jgi:hypothetical protein
LIDRSFGSTRSNVPGDSALLPADAHPLRRRSPLAEAAITLYVVTRLGRPARSRARGRDVDDTIENVVRSNGVLF